MYFRRDEPKITRHPQILPRPETFTMAKPVNFFDPFATSPPVSEMPGVPETVVMAIGGLGTISVKSQATKSIQYIVHPSDPAKQPTLTLTVTEKSCVLYKRDSDSGSDEVVSGCTFPKGVASAYLNVASKVEPTVYWISVDRSNGRFRYGQHFTNASMTFLEKDFGKDHAWMDNLVKTDITQDDEVSNTPATMPCRIL